MARDRLLLKPGDRIVFEGDSLTSRRAPGSLDTWPFLELMDWHETYAHHVARLLFCLRPDLRLGFTHAAVGGSSCREVLGRLDGLVLPLKPAWVVMTIGPNDASRKIPLREFRDTMAGYAGRIRHCGGRVMFLGGMRPCPHCPPAKPDAYRACWPYYRTLQQVARQVDGVYCDVGKVLLAKARLLYKQHPAHTVYSDGGHLNAVGNIILAGEVIKALGATW
jgi:lysophospholipase L1-like esterase